MLRLHFINVGDGDAVLVEEWEKGGPFRLLVDVGRGDVGECSGSQRLTAAAYLRERGITRLNGLVVTHLHSDHFGGLAALLDVVEVGAVYSGFFPCPPVGRINRTGMEEKTVSGLLDCLGQWTALTARMAACGCCLHQVEESGEVLLTPRLRGTFVCPDPKAAARQRMVWTALLSGERPDMAWWSSKYRNPGSLRLRLDYAGRRIELAGDCYGAVWEDEAEPCDIFKVPHHGDAKSVTPLLAERLRAEHAIISCAAEHIPRKDRPSAAVISLLEKQGARVWFTDSFVWSGRKPGRWPSVDFIIRKDGTILPPEEN